jgi:hypothetical protein
MKFKILTFSPLLALLGLGVATLVAWGLSRWTSLPFWRAFALVASAMFINGIVAEREDDAPGGFNDPLPAAEPKTAAKNSVEAKKMV